VTEKERRKGSGGKLSRSETVTVRLDPKLRYLADLAARKQRRTLSSFIEWAIEDTLNRVIIEHDGPGSQSIADQAAQLWDVDEPDRFTRLALNHPDLLAHDEQVVWKLIRENGFLWRGRYINNEWTWQVHAGSLIIERLRKYWDKFVGVAKGEQTNDALPNWADRKASLESPNNDFVPEIADEEDISF
jgi:hypothetical protein